MLLCANRAFYTGWTMDISRRLQQHKKGMGANYTKMNAPVELVYWETHHSDKIARKREIALKRLSHKMKKKIAQGGNYPQKDISNFQQYEYFVSSPGRVNLLGEHVDYNGGPVLPVAIDRAVSLWANARSENIFTIRTVDLDQEVTFSTESLQGHTDIEGKPLAHWANYPAGVIWAAQENKLPIQGFDAIFSSNVPIGSGLSSSAALQIAFAAQLREISKWKIDNMEMAKMCQQAENAYVGVNSGIMDQFACANGVENSALYLNTDTMNWFPVPLPEDLAIIIADSKIRRSLATSAYNERRGSCGEALAILQQHIPDLQYLGQVQPETFEAFAKALPAIPYKRAKHVVEECQRVEKAVNFLKSGDVIAFGELMKQGHESLKTLYEVSLPEIDVLVDIANQSALCFGSRLTGAGFGGCTVSLVPQKHAKEFMEYLKTNYKNRTGLDADIYACKARPGAWVEWRKRS
jgi:galactokinase